MVGVEISGLGREETGENKSQRNGVHKEPAIKITMQERHEIWSTIAQGTENEDKQEVSMSYFTYTELKYFRQDAQLSDFSKMVEFSRMWDFQT